MSFHRLLFYLLLAAAVVLAFRIGGRSERQVAAMLLAATLCSKAVAWQPFDHFVRFETGLFLVDLLLLAGLVAVALTSDRFWPLWIAALHAYSVVAHLGEIASPTIGIASYITNTALTADAGLILLMIGTWRHHRRSSREFSATS